jgi:nicotinate-nucleotide adenylyltransferase
VKIGIFGGTFDPIHLGHLRAAENAREALALDDVYFVPAHTPPHRPGAVSSATDRYAMVALATSAHPAFVTSDVELRRGGPSYTVDTLMTLREELAGRELVLILGSDAFGEIATWREPERIFAMCKVAVVHRPGEPPKSERALDLSADRVSWVEAAGLPVSATEIRKRVGEKRSVRYLVPDAVADYIQKRGLYR